MLGFKLYVLIAVLTYTVVLCAFEIPIYFSFHIFTWDLGIFNQAFWNTLHGRFLYYTAEPFFSSTGCFFAAHFSPTILTALPFYAIYPRAETLLVISTFIVAIGAFPAYEIANYLVRNEKIAAILGIFYLLYPPLQGVTLSGFSPEPFAATLFLFIVLYLIKSDFKKLALCVALGLLTHEAAAPVIAFIALYGLLYHRSIKSKGFQASIVILAFCIPYFFFAQQMRLFFGWTGSPSLWHEWSLIGATGPVDIPFKLFTNPIGAWTALTYDGTTKLFFVIMLLLPTSFLALLGLQGLIPAIPFLSAGLFSSYPLYYSLEGHYTAFIAPFVFVALVHGIVRLQPKFKLKDPAPRMLKLTGFIILTCLLSLFIILPTSYSSLQAFNISEVHDNTVYSFIMRIPSNASVLTQSNIFPHLSNRPDAYTIPPPTWSKEYERAAKKMLLNLNMTNVEYVLLDLKSPDPQYVSEAQLIQSDFILPNKDRYNCIGDLDGVVLFKMK
jgi:uncharacterized membrane protein